MGVTAVGALTTTREGKVPGGEAWLRALAPIATIRAPIGGVPCGAKPAHWGALAAIIVAPARVFLRLCWTPRRLALQLLQFPVDRAQTPLTGDVLPPAHYEGAS